MAQVKCKFYIKLILGDSMKEIGGIATSIPFQLLRAPGKVNCCSGQGLEAEMTFRISITRPMIMVRILCLVLVRSRGVDHLNGIDGSRLR